MTDEGFEIEYLDEDEDLVQQCVQGTSTGKNTQTVNTDNLVNRQPRKKRKYESDDYDYVPEEEKRKSQPQNKTTERRNTINYSNQKKKLTYTPLKNDILSQRKLLNVTIPDYDDPLCLPVQCIKTGKADEIRLKNWNRMCLDQLSLADKMFRPDSGEETVRSTRTTVFKCEHTKGSGFLSIYSKTTCESKSNDHKSAIFQCFLPRYKGKMSTRMYRLLPNKKPSRVTHVDEVILTKEVVNESDTLVVYKPKDFVSSLYMFEEDDDKSSDNLRRLRELSVTKMCAPCYQTSWRGSRNNEKRTISCVICKRSQVSVYSLLTHLKTHSDVDVRMHSKQISRTLASVVDYHYKCRICLKKFESIKLLRKHVLSHKGANIFHCEIGNHQTT